MNRSAPPAAPPREQLEVRQLSDAGRLVISPAVENDLPAILALQKLAFRSEAELYDDFSIPPLTQTLESMAAEFPAKVFLKACLENVIVGSVRGFEKDSTCYVERLIVHPDCQGRGVGTALMRALEARFPDARCYELFTGHRRERNLRLYRKLGYSVFKEEGRLVFMEKRRA